MPLPPQPAGFGIPSASGGPGITINTHAAPGTAGTIYVDVDAFGVPDEFELLYNGVVVATTGGPISGKARLSFAYPAAPALDFQVRVTGPTGTAWTYTPYFDNAPPLAVPPPAAEPALTVLKNIDGEMFTIERRNLTTQALGLSALTLDPLSAGLAALDNAQTVVAEALGYFGATDRSLRGLTGIANAVTDGTGEGLGSMVDADLAAESARLIAAQIRVELSSQGLSIANAAPDHLRQLFSTQD